MGRAVFHLRNPSTVAHILLSGARSFQENGSMAASRRSHANEYPPELPSPVSLSPQWATAIPSFTSTRDSPLLASRPDSILTRSLLFSLGSGVHKTLHVPSKGGNSVSPSHVEFLWSNLAFTPVGELLWYNYFTVYMLLTQCILDLILSWWHSSYS